MVKHIWIITGGRVDLDWLSSLWPALLNEQEENRVITADKGLLYAKEAGICPDKIIGDFDSLPADILKEYEKLDIPIRRYPPEKDYTDTHLALMWAVEEKADKVTIIGGTGSRFDHSFANIGLLSYLLNQGIEGEIIDPNNRIFMMDKEHTGEKTITREKKEEYVSLIPYTQEVTGITLTGFYYPLKNETLEIGISRGISNQLLKEEGTIAVESGILMVIISNDSEWGRS
ncbi:MAG: thiamine diphosphokinase [Lachnospiraceae bacterium]|nr:thiamine diphosphokinase [Lachnospiraceae bacterium]